MLNAVYEDDIFADGESVGFTNGRIDALSKFLSNGGTVEDAERFLDATDEEIQLAQSKISSISPF